MREVSRIGDVLREVVALGGQGGLVTRLDAWEGEVVRRREGGVEEGDVYKALDEKRVSTLMFGVKCVDCGRDEADEVVDGDYQAYGLATACDDTV